MKYAITFAPEAQEGLAKLKRSEPASYKKAVFGGNIWNIARVVVSLQCQSEQTTSERQYV